MADEPGEALQRSHVRLGGDSGGDDDSTASHRMAVAGLAALALLLLVAAGLLLMRSRPAPVVITGGPSTTVVPDGDLPTVTPTAPSLVVHVSGAVHAPGVFTVAAGGRVADAVAAAGGPTPEADPHALNLARALSDGDKVHVPRVGEAPPPEPTLAGMGGPRGAAGPVNVNTASSAELEALPGIGPVLAARIVEHRPYHEVRDLIDVPGIGEKVLARLEPLVTV